MQTEKIMLFDEPHAGLGTGDWSRRCFEYHELVLAETAWNHVCVTTRWALARTVANTGDLYDKGEILLKKLSLRSSSIPENERTKLF